VPLLREKFGLPGDASDLAYDAKLAAAVRKFQQVNELPATGNLDARTIKELNGPIRDKQINLVIANQKWRCRILAYPERRSTEIPLGGTPADSKR
jgi:murein L,D-transpeptidase YcbB/YkuD